MLQGQRRHLQTGNPPLRFVLEGLHQFRSQREADGLVEKQRGLLQRKTQVVEADLAQAVLHAPACQRQIWNLPADQDQAQLIGHVLDQKADGQADFRG